MARKKNFRRNDKQSIMEVHGEFREEKTGGGETQL